MNEMKKNAKQTWSMTKEEMNTYFRENVNLIHKLLQSYVAPHGAIDYEDLFQHASIGFFKGMMTYKPQMGTKLSTYCYQCADNEVKQVFRQISAQARRPDEMPLSIDAVHRDDEDRGGLLSDTIDVPDGGINPRRVSPEEEAEVSAMEDIVRTTCRTKLTEMEAKVFKLKADGWTQTDISEKLHISQANVSKNLAIGRSKVAFELKKAGFLEDGSMGAKHKRHAKPAKEKGKPELTFKELTKDDLASGK